MTRDASWPSFRTAPSTMHSSRLSCVYTGIPIDVPRFDADGYIVFPPLVTSRALVVSVELKPDSADGLLLYNADVQSRFKDFVAVSLTRGYLQLRFGAFRIFFSGFVDR